MTSLNSHDMDRRLPSTTSWAISPPDLSFTKDSFNDPFSCIPDFHDKSLPRPSFFDTTLPPISFERRRAQSDMDLPSPPVTPRTASTKYNSIGPDQIATPAATPSSSRDPVLFPSSERRSSLLAREPLFAPEVAPVAEAIVDEHIARQKAKNKGEAELPSRDEYYLAIACTPVVATQYNRNPGAWALREREILDQQFERTHPTTTGASKSDSKLKKIAPAPKRTTTTSTTSANASRVTKPQRAKRTPRSTPKTKTLESFIETTATPTRSTPSKPRVIGTNRDDTDWRSLPDFCPPAVNLETVKTLKADWKGTPLDLSNDPNRNCLAEQEIILAASLRLSCASYLCSKRRIFQRRVEALKNGKEFRKTDAQQSCRIDVNKASKLWIAFEKLGWFKPHWFERYL